MAFQSFVSWTLGQLLPFVLSEVVERPGPPAVCSPSPLTGSLPPGTAEDNKEGLLWRNWNSFSSLFLNFSRESQTTVNVYFGYLLWYCRRGKSVTSFVLAAPQNSSLEPLPPLHPYPSHRASAHLPESHLLFCWPLSSGDRICLWLSTAVALRPDNVAEKKLKTDFQGNESHLQGARKATENSRRPWGRAEHTFS